MEELQQVLHMNGGEGDTSYDKNSSHQKLVLTKAKPVLEKCIQELVISSSILPKCIRVADLGCSSGPNTLSTVLGIIESLDKACHEKNHHHHHEPPPRIQRLPGFYEKLEKENGRKYGSCFIAAMPGSFYGRLFPDHSMHFLHSSYCLHWLSQVPSGLVTESGIPLNKGSLYLAKTSPPRVHKAYLDQFTKDFTTFLRMHSEELVPRGRILLTFMCKGDEIDGPNFLDVLDMAINDLVLEGHVAEEKLDSFNMPNYTPTVEEVRFVTEEEGSFEILNLETFKLSFDATYPVENDQRFQLYDDQVHARAAYVAALVRAVYEPILACHFGEAVMPDLFNRFAKNTEKKLVLTKVKPVLEKCIQDLFSSCSLPIRCITVADLGCSSGPNTVSTVLEIIESIDKAWHEMINHHHEPPRIQVFLNDLFGNDFNTVFKLLPGFYEKLEKENGRKYGSCLVAAMPGSFYGRLFPDHSVHFLHSSYSLHWLSQVPSGLVTESGIPLNKGSIYFAKTSPPHVHKAYLDQFTKDFTMFLRMHSEELVPRGHILLTFMCKGDEIDGSNNILELLLDKAINDLVVEGHVEEEKLDSFNIPLYAPSVEEAKYIIEGEGSFEILNLQTFKLPIKAEAAVVARSIRAIYEPMLASHFGEAIMPDLFNRFAKETEKVLQMGKGFNNNMIISLAKK
ncbi:hypothetical protein ACH5RR_016516 [Cinchona calisaya]|uniref:Uncharacterized protein n=1 Tax=Cinchona calisaya TaxID=153742 RepID=A0ABD2ZZU6_9GENT